MKIYSDKRISFSYPDNFRIVRAKKRLGQYDLADKDGTLIDIALIPHHAFDSVEALMRNNSFDKITAKKEFWEYVAFGKNEGIGHVFKLFDIKGTFYEKIYRYLFPIESGGIHVQIFKKKTSR